MLERSKQLNEANAFLESILTSLRAAVVVVNNELEVNEWNARAEDLWGLRSTEVRGRHFLNLDFGLPVGQLNQPIRDCLRESVAVVEVMLPSTNRRGRAFDCRVTCMPLRRGLQVSGAILLMEEDGAHSDGR
jgi:two-component system CheB/CheR fusion protein